MNTPLNELAEACHKMARDKGFWDPSTGNNVGEKLMMIVGEIAEAHEEYRAGHPIGLIEYEHHLDEGPERARTAHVFSPEYDAENGLPPGKPVGFAIELADSIIRTLDLAAGNGIDIAEAIRIKMAYNANRPRMHGGKIV